ncbi:MAG: TPM domain-containing protein [Thiomonas sp.]
MRIKRLIRHLNFMPWQLRRAFPRRTQRAIAEAVAHAERQHGGEIRFVVEGALSIAELWRDVSPRQRAIEVFSQLRVWDTEHNDGVLIYLLLADRAVEIVADRGIARRVEQAAWERVCRGMEALLRQGRFQDAALQGIADVSALLAQHTPPRPEADKRNELPDWPVVLRR